MYAGDSINHIWSWMLASSTEEVERTVDKRTTCSAQ